jgi:hypothetical protein
MTIYATEIGLTIILRFYYPIAYPYEHARQKLSLCSIKLQKRQKKKLALLVDQLS